MKNLWIIIFLLVLLAGFGAFYLYNDKEAVSVPIESDFGSKVVYTTDTSADTEPFIAHCQSRSGTFNTCGTVCEPGAAVCAQVCAYTCDDIPGADTGPDTTTWETYDNSEYDFALRYPENDWSMEVDTSFEFSPKYNFYVKPQGVPLELPITHHSNVSNISVFPLGIPTEGVFSQSREFDLETGFPVNKEQSRVFVLEDGTPYAAFVKPTNLPESWGDAGFIWIYARVDDLTTRCERDGEVVGQGECDPLVEDDQIFWNGEVDQDFWKKALASLETFEFTPAE